MKKTFLFGIFFLFIVSCQYDPYAHLYITEKPTIESAVGTYQFDFQTLSDQLDNEKLKQRKSRIVLSPNQTFHIYKLPYFKEVDVFNHKYDRSITTSGTWKIEVIGSVSNGGDHSENYWGIVLESVPKELRRASFLGDKKPNGIVFGYGDPDQGEVLLLRKVE